MFSKKITPEAVFAHDFPLMIHENGNRGIQRRPPVSKNGISSNLMEKMEETSKPSFSLFRLKETMPWNCGEIMEKKCG